MKRKVGVGGEVGELVTGDVGPGFEGDLTTFGWVESRGRDGRAWERWAGPFEVDVGVLREVGIFELQVVASTGDEGHGGGVIDGRGRGPLIDDEDAIDPESSGLIGLEVKGGGFGVDGFDLTGPADGEEIGGECGVW